MKQIKGRDLYFKAKNKKTGEEGYIDASEFVGYIFKLHTEEVLIPLIKEMMSQNNSKEKNG